MTVSMTKTTPAAPAPAEVPLHESFTKSFGETALDAHAQGAHARTRSLVCSACRDEQR